MDHFVSRKMGLVEHCLVPFHTSPKLFSFPDDDFDILGDMLVDQEGVHVTVCIEQGVVECGKGFK